MKEIVLLLLLGFNANGNIQIEHISQFEGKPLIFSSTEHCSSFLQHLKGRNIAPPKDSRFYCLETGGLENFIITKGESHEKDI